MDKEKEKKPKGKRESFRKRASQIRVTSHVTRTQDDHKGDEIEKLPSQDFKKRASQLKVAAKAGLKTDLPASTEPSTSNFFFY